MGAGSEAEGRPTGTDAAEPTDAWRATRVGAAATTLVGLSILAVAAWTGLSVRPAGEDYCAAWRTRDTGLGGIVHYYYFDFSGRVSNAAANAVVFSHGIVGQRLLPGLLLASLALGTFVLLRQLLRLGEREAPVLATVSVAVGITVLLMLGSEARYQVLFWAAGSLTHTLPTVMVVWMAVHAFSAWQRGPVAQALSLGLATLVAVSISTLSEAAGAVSGILAVGAFAVLLEHARRARDWFVVAWPAAWVLGLAVGAVVLRTSPGLASRTERPTGAPSLFSPEGLGATANDLVSTWSTILGHTPAYLVALTLGVLLGLSCSRPRTSPRTRLVHRFEVLPAVVVLVSSLAVVAELRLGYGDRGWRVQRAYTSFLYPTLLAFAFYGALAGLALRRTPLRRVTALAAAAVTVAGMASLVPALMHSRDVIRERSKAWDAESAVMFASGHAGLEMARYTPYPVDSVSEPFRNWDYPHDWAAHCVEHYYRIPSIVPSHDWLRSDASAGYRRAHPFVH